jgi:uncharacterized protein
METRLLDASDAAELEVFLAAHRDSSMFLRSNARKAGLVFLGERFQATYVAGYRDGRMVGVVAHSWRGMLLLQAPDEVEEIARACVEQSGRVVTGFAGPLEQARRARRALGLEGAAAVMDSSEALYALELEALALPAALVERRATCRAPLPEERGTLYDWRHAYELEVLGGRDTPEARQAAAAGIDAIIAEGNVWVAVVSGQPASLAAFNATLPDIVQLGGIYTPPALRGRGHARVVVAGSLEVAKQRGVTRAVLFTDNPSAVCSYEAVGFRRVGDYALVRLSD